MIDPPFGTYAPSWAQERIIRLARRSFLRRGAYRNMLRDFVLGLRDGPIDYHFRKCNFRLNLRDNTSEPGLLFNADYNAEEVEFLRDGLKSGGVFVDVGANIGQFALTLAEAAGPDGKVLAVEPDPMIRTRLEANLAANTAANIRLVPYALGDRVGEVSFIRDPNNLGHSRVGEGGAITVQMKPLLAVLQDAGVEAIDAFKIDVEGFEDRVLNPFFETAPRTLWPRRVVIEKLHTGEGDTPVERMLALGYREYGSNRANVFLVLDAA